MAEYNLKESAKRIGRLIPVLTDAKGNIIDGIHRKKADPDWEEMRLESIDNETKLTLARAIANWDRRKMSRKEKTKLLDRLCELNPSWEHNNSFVDALINKTGKAERTIRLYLSPKYKQVHEVGKPCRLSSTAYKLYQGDFEQVCQTLEPSSIDLIVTDPPYAEEFLDPVSIFFIRGVLYRALSF